MLKYQSTRQNYEKVSSSEAIKLGMVPSGGLFVPEKIPQLNAELYDLRDLEYQDIAYEILKLFLPDFSDRILRETVDSSYQDNFKAEEVVTLSDLKDNVHLLELWHGPTGAFKDIPLQFMPRLLSTTTENDTVILVATSGDTGKAALEGFKDVEGTQIIVFYPKDGVSNIQERQMITTGGRNTATVALEGNFDDCQNGVKDIFSDKNFKDDFRQNFSSANSINWERLVPQIVYWIASYLRLLNRGEIERGEEIDIVVPTGNFGNILSAYYAERVGLPVHKLVCASNENNVLTDFFRTGRYGVDRELKKTISPAMDILISSNLERFLFHACGKNSEKINSWYSSLSEEGKFKVGEETKGRMDEVFHGEFATDKETLETISRTFEKHDYLLDPHTAVGVKCFEKYRRNTDHSRATIIASTANPFKFAPSVLKALTDREPDKGDFEAMEELEEITDREIHWGLKGLKEKEVKNKHTCPKDGIRDVIRNILRD